jgi:hypothetical protein
MTLTAKFYTKSDTRKVFTFELGCNMSSPLPGFTLINEHDWRLLQTGGDLTDHVINEASALLFQSEVSNPFNIVTQDTLRGVNGFYRSRDQSAQICHVPGHWILLLGSVHSVLVFDSLNFGRIRPQVIRYARDLFGEGKTIELAPCQQQFGSTDCGLFSIANLQVERVYRKNDVGCHTSL